jgi:hypothetical protein
MTRSCEIEINNDRKQKWINNYLWKSITNQFEIIFCKIKSGITLSISLFVLTNLNFIAQGVSKSRLNLVCL